MTGEVAAEHEEYEVVKSTNDGTLQMIDRRHVRTRRPPRGLKK